MKFLNTKYMRIIRKTDSKVIGMLAYTADADFKNYYFGVSLCHPNDVFDKEMGKRIAANRMALAGGGVSGPKLCCTLSSANYANYVRLNRTKDSLIKTSLIEDTGWKYINFRLVVMKALYTLELDVDNIRI